MSSVPTWKTATASQEELRKAFENAKEATATIKTEHVGEDGLPVATLLNMAEGLGKSITFWSSQELPLIPEIYVANSETGTTPRSKL